MKIIGITGTLGAGKGTIVDFLVHKKGFKHYSVRAFISREIVRRGLEVNRDNMVVVANDLRAKHTPSYIIDCLFDEAHINGENAIIESIRTPGEVVSLRKKENFILISVDADIRIRYERAVMRGSETDHISFEKFQKDEQTEFTATDPNKQNLKKCIEMADIQIDNNGTMEELEQLLEQKLNYL
ncbi:MAG: AAA family ATPase [Bacteroidales bacterium]|nr:AAA family ATPase [Bacteroidales bacterium]